MTNTTRELQAPPDEFFEINGIKNQNGWLGFEITKCEYGDLAAEMVVRADHLNPMGGLHGGVSASFADSLAGYGTVTSRPADCIGFATVNLQASYLGAALEGETLSAIGTLVRGGRQLQVWDIVVACGDRQVIDARITQLLRYPK